MVLNLSQMKNLSYQAVQQKAAYAQQMSGA
jgi:hypothetical protein